MNEPLVSIIVPVYNAEKYLPDCIDSCIGQSYRNIEIILVDDGSVDDSLALCLKYACRDQRIKVIHQENAGVSAARNTGLRNATGECIFFLDSDDELYSYTIELLLNDMTEYQADIASGVFSKVDQAGWEYCRYNDGSIRIYEGIEPLLLSLKYDRQTNSACAKLYSSRILGNIFFVEGRRINEDGYFVFQCYAKQPRVVQHNESVYKYHIWENSSTRGLFSEKYFDMIYFSDLKMEYIKTHHPSLTEYAKDMEVSTHLFLLDTLCRDTDNRYADETKKSIRIVRKRFFKYRSVNKHERKMAAVVMFGLYPLYKRFFISKYLKNQL